MRTNYQLFLLMCVVSSIGISHGFLTVKRICPRVGSTIKTTPFNSNQRVSLVYALNKLNEETGSKPDNLDSLAVPKYFYAAVWVSLLVYAFTLAPVGDPEYPAKVIEKAIVSPYDGETNPLFIAIFNFLGVYPGIFASLLLPGSKNQKVPAAPFVFGSFAFGFFGLGPYLGLREINTSGIKSDAGIGNRLFESKLSSIALLGFTLYLSYYAITGQLISGEDKFQDFIQLFSTQQIVHVSTIDFTILTLAVWEPMKEDMIRRKWTGPNSIVMSSIPLIGPLIYLLLRSPLQEDDEKKNLI